MKRYRRMHKHMHRGGVRISEPVRVTLVVCSVCLVSGHALPLVGQSSFQTGDLWDLWPTSCVRSARASVPCNNRVTNECPRARSSIPEAQVRGTHRPRGLSDPLARGRTPGTSGFWILPHGRRPCTSGFWILIKIFFGARCARPAPDPSFWSFQSRRTPPSGDSMKGDAQASLGML